LHRSNYAKVNDVLDADIVAFGCASMQGNTIESDKMQPFITEFKSIPVDKKKCFLFGSYGWDKGEFMDKWIKTMIDYDITTLKKKFDEFSSNSIDIEDNINRYNCQINDLVNFKMNIKELKSENCIDMIEKKLRENSHQANIILKALIKEVYISKSNEFTINYRS